MASLIIPSWVDQYTALLRDGVMPATAAEAVGTTLKRVEALRQEVEDFDDACTSATEQLVDQLEDKAFKLALNGSEKSIYHQGALIGTETQENKDLIMFLLKANRKKYNDKLAVQAVVDTNIMISVASFTTNPANAREVIDVTPISCSDLV